MAERCFLPEDTIKTVLDAFIAISKDAFQRDTRVILRHFGAFKPRRTVVRGYAGVTIRFRPAKELKDDIKKEAVEPMEKYGVEMKNEAVLLARVTKKCPECKTDLDQIDPPHCPNCGTQPFEEKK